MPLGPNNPLAPKPQNGNAFSNIPWWGWVAGIGVIVVLFLVMRSGSSQNSTQQGANSTDQQQLSDLQSSLEQLLAQSGSSSSGMGGGGAGDGLTATAGSAPPIQFLGPPTQAPPNSGGSTTVVPPINVGPPTPKPASSSAISTATASGPTTRSTTQAPTSSVATISDPQSQLASEISVYQKIAASGGKLTPKQAAALKTDINTYETQYGALSGGVNPVAVTSRTPGQNEIIAPSQIQGANLPTGKTGEAASRLKHLGYSVDVPAVSPTVMASKTSSTPFAKTIAGGGTAKVT